MDCIIIVSTLSGLNLSLCRDKECAKPRRVALTSVGIRSGTSDGRCSLMALYISPTEDWSETILRDSPGSCAMALPSLGSATAREALVSSLSPFSSSLSFPETFESERAAASFKAVTAFSNFYKRGCEFYIFLLPNSGAYGEILQLQGTDDILNSLASLKDLLVFGFEKLPSN